MPALGGAAALAAGGLARWTPYGAAFIGVFALASLYFAFRSIQARALALLSAALLACFAWLSVSPPPADNLPFNESLRLRGKVDEDPALSEKGYRMAVALEAIAPAPPEGEWKAAEGTILLSVEGDFERAPALGDRVVFRSTLHSPYGFRNPGTLWHSLYVARKGIRGRAYAKLGQTAFFAEPGPGADVLYSYRRNLSRAMERAWPGPAGASVRSMTVGDRSGLDRETYDLFSRTGTIHLLSISGVHLAVILLFGIWLARASLVRITPLVLARPVEPIARLAALIPVTAYAILAGLSIATLRSLVMTAMVVAAGFAGRRISFGSLLASTAFVLLLISPLSAADPGFQLTLAALIGLYAVPGLIKPPEAFGERFPRLSRAMGGAAGLLAASFAATLFTAPIAAYHFGNGGWAGIAYNCAAVPLTGFVTLPASLAGMLLYGVWEPAGTFFFKIAGFSMEGLLALMRLVPDWEPAGLNAPFSNIFGLAGYFTLLSSLFLTRAPKWSRLTAAVAGIFLLAAVPLGTRALASLDTGATFWALDVGDGQAIAGRLPGGKWVLIDGGGIPGSPVDVGRTVVWPALSALGCDRLDTVVSTHPHPDHISGLYYAVRAGRPKRLVFPALFADDPAERALAAAARAVGASVVEVPGDFRTPVEIG